MQEYVIPIARLYDEMTPAADNSVRITGEEAFRRSSTVNLLRLSIKAKFRHRSRLGDLDGLEY